MILWVALLTSLMVMIYIIVTQKKDAPKEIPEDLGISGIDTQVSSCGSHKYMLASETKCVSSCPSGTTANSSRVCKCTDTTKVFDTVTESCQTYCSSGYEKSGDHCLICPAGTYYNSIYKSCEPCSAGSYSSSSGALSCISCSPGSYTPVRGSKSCLSCPGANAGASICL